MSYAYAWVQILLRLRLNKSLSLIVIHDKITKRIQQISLLPRWVNFSLLIVPFVYISLHIQFETLL